MMVSNFLLYNFEQEEPLFFLHETHCAFYKLRDSNSSLLNEKRIRTAELCHVYYMFIFIYIHPSNSLIHNNFKLLHALFN